MISTAARDPDFEATLAADPADQRCRLIYSDWVLDHGDESYARALRWLADRDKHPIGDVVRLFGGPQNGGNHARLQPAKLDEAVYARVRALIRDEWFVGRLPEWFEQLRDGLRGPFMFASWLTFASCQQATEYLARALDLTEPTE